MVGPGFVDQAMEIVVGAPGEQGFCFGVVEPGGPVRRGDVDGRKIASLAEVLGGLAVVDRFVHGNVEDVAKRSGMIEGEENGI